MAENIVPPKPANPYEEGTAEAYNAAKEAMVRVVGQQGQYGLQQLRNREAAAQQLAAAAPAAQGRDAATQALYDVFQRDAQQSQQQYGQNQALLNQANVNYQNQAYGGLQLQARDMDAYYEAMRRAAEQKELDRRAEQARLDQQLQMQRESHAASLAATRASMARNAPKSPEQEAEEKYRYNKRITELGLEGRSKTDILPSEIASTGGRKASLSKRDAYKAVGYNDATINAYEKGKVDRNYERMVKDIIANAKKEDMTWDAVLADAQAMLGTAQARTDYGIRTAARGGAPLSQAAIQQEFLQNIQPLLLMYSGDWGLDPQDWVQGYVPPARGRGGLRPGSSA